MCMTRLLCVIMYKNGREKMWQFILGSAGFLLYFIYDINSIKKKNTFFQKFFRMGDGSGGFITRHGALALVGAVPAQNRKNNWIWNRSLVFPCTSYIYLVFLPFPLKKLTVKKTNYVRHIQRVCTVCAVIPEFYGSQEHIFACGECLADGNRESIF